MNSIVILLFFLLIIIYLFNNCPQEKFVQVKSNYNINKNNFITKPVQLSLEHNQTVKKYDRDDPVFNPKYSPNIIPDLMTSSANLYLPGQSNGLFEQSYNKHNTNYKQPSIQILSPSTNNTNLKAIRPSSGHLIRPIELDYTPSINTQVEKPFLTKKTLQAYSKFLDYADALPYKTYNYKTTIF